MTIRPATISDAPFIALVIAEALGDDIMERCQENISEQDGQRLALLADSIRTDNTLYSWRHTSIAQDTNGTPLGAIVAYPADNYMQMRATPLLCSATSSPSMWKAWMPRHAPESIMWTALP